MTWHNTQFVFSPFIVNLLRTHQLYNSVNLSVICLIKLLRLVSCINRAVSSANNHTESEPTACINHYV